jgi:protein tyrosine/serine phosphatase
MTNTPIQVFNGTLTMCGLDDFMETIKIFHEPENVAVVTLCDKPHRQWHGETYCHYLSYKKFTPIEHWTAAAQKVLKLLREGRNVVLHCIHGRDRTGTIAFVVLMKNAPPFRRNSTSILQKMYEARPSRAREWKTLMKERQTFHDALLKTLD